MSDQKTNNSKGNIYDRIFRENAEHLFIPLVEHFLPIKIASYKILQVSFPQTSEHEVDFLYEIIDENQTKLILHIEFQSANDPAMLQRMQEYHSKIFKKFGLPVESLVINLGQRAFTARTQLKPEEIFTGYRVINLFELSTEELLSAQVPEVVILAFLANYPKNQIEAVLRLTLKKLKQIVVKEKDLRRYLTQLLLLSRLRNFEERTQQIINTMPITYDIETDGLYLQGIEKGIEKGIILCYKKGFSAEEIAKDLNISLKKVLRIIQAYLSDN